MKIRARNFSFPYVNTTVREFLRDIDNPDIVRVALDFPLAQLSMPYPFE